MVNLPPHGPKRGQFHSSVNLNRENSQAAIL